jgi:hypothetical protein
MAEKTPAATSWVVVTATSVSPASSSSAQEGLPLAHHGRPVRA